MTDIWNLVQFIFISFHFPGVTITSLELQRSHSPLQKSMKFLRSKSLPGWTSMTLYLWHVRTLLKYKTRKVLNSKLWRCKWSRSPNRLISWLIHLLIEVFDLNLKPDFNLSRQNRLIRVRIKLKRLKSIHLNLQEIEINQKWSKNLK